jgi:hypothetical protein
LGRHLRAASEMAKAHPHRPHPISALAPRDFREVPAGALLLPCAVLPERRLLGIELGWDIIPLIFGAERERPKWSRCRRSAGPVVGGLSTGASGPPPSGLGVSV